MINFKTVNDGRTKGIIVTAETLINLRQEFQVIKDRNPSTYAGAMLVIECLEDCFKMIKKDY